MVIELFCRLGDADKLLHASISASLVKEGGGGLVKREFEPEQPRLIQSNTITPTSRGSVTSSGPAESALTLSGTTGLEQPSRNSCGMINPWGLAVINPCGRCACVNAAINGKAIDKQGHQ